VDVGGWYDMPESSTRAEAASAASLNVALEVMLGTASWGSDLDLGALPRASSMVGSSSWTISRLEGVRRWRGRLGKRGGEPTAITCVSGVVPKSPPGGHGKEEFR
jgi:hypothetical protein